VNIPASEMNIFMRGSSVELIGTSVSSLILGSATKTQALLQFLDLDQPVPTGLYDKFRPISVPQIALRDELINLVSELFRYLHIDIRSWRRQRVEADSQ